MFSKKVASFKHLGLTTTITNDTAQNVASSILVVNRYDLFCTAKWNDVSINTKPEAWSLTKVKIDMVNIWEDTYVRALKWGTDMGNPVSKLQWGFRSEADQYFVSFARTDSPFCAPITDQIKTAVTVLTIAGIFTILI